MRPSTFAIACLLGLSGAGAAAADTVRLAQGYGAQVIPPFEVFTIVQSIDLRPLGRPYLRGRSYVLHAVDRRGEEVRVVVDAYAARVMSVTPVHRGAAADDEGPLPPDPESRPLPGGPRVIEADPRYVPPASPRYGTPQILPDDDDDFADDPDEIDAEPERETGSLPSGARAQTQHAVRTPPALSAHGTRGIKPARTPLPRPRPELREAAAAQAEDVGAPAAQPATPAASAAEDRPAADDKPAAAAPSTHESAKPSVRIIDMTKPKPRI